MNQIEQIKKWHENHVNLTTLDHIILFLMFRNPFTNPHEMYLLLFKHYRQTRYVEVKKRYTRLRNLKLITYNVAHVGYQVTPAGYKELSIILNELNE